VYNHGYDPYKEPLEDRPDRYSPYVFGEPLYNDREVIIARLLLYTILAGLSRKPRTQWVWKLRYALADARKNKAKTTY
jgi:hypothetical protein